MDIVDAIENRRSIRNFKRINVAEDILKEIFTYASYAPSHYMTESWQIKLYQDKGKESFIDEIMLSYQRIGLVASPLDEKSKKMILSMTEFLMKIPHHALIYFEKLDDPIRFEEEYASICAFIQNAQLVAWKYGVGMLWTITPYMHDKDFIKAIDLEPTKHKIAAVMQIGYPESIPPNKGRMPIDKKLEIISD
ncbi:nitroreductase family protein [Virgibacillus soli]|uniref:Nitroreductase family protein n=1 Tax=Paracerasibacillus soli TaxID=480284 RepID=A0ABU5CSJ6_9BACI|nr:nitroreductase family protein [Virgibacillus soli]MDY0408851.1 nitroreductase family protein [Virgibacillus soli]